MTDIRWMSGSDSDAVVAASHLFDDPVQPELAADFVNRSGHHIAIAYVDDEPAGFVSGVEIAHPDKAVEMLLYELGVDDAFHGRGIGKALVAALRDRAAELGCRGMWVLTDHDNEAAVRTYQSAGGSDLQPQVLIEWDLTQG
ncbi:MAG: GNAT family N-acetyltransferase [Acidimicrobiales bacterium]|nr:GNAT family N-acetyltransferase [Acidimicrobiales bacterium]